MAPLPIRAFRSRQSIWPAAVAAAVLLLAATLVAAQLAPSSPSGGRASASQPDGNGVLLFPDNVFELPIQVNETGFQLKHAIRPEQKRDGDGSCTEAIATSYHPEHYWPLKTATAVTLHLPWGALPLSEARFSASQNGDAGASG